MDHCVPGGLGRAIASPARVAVVHRAADGKKSTAASDSAARSCSAAPIHRLYRRVAALNRPKRTGSHVLTICALWPGRSRVQHHRQIQWPAVRTALAPVWCWRAVSACWAEICPSCVRRRAHRRRRLYGALASVSNGKPQSPSLYSKTLACRQRPKLEASSARDRWDHPARFLCHLDTAGRDLRLVWAAGRAKCGFERPGLRQSHTFAKDRR